MVAPWKYKIFNNFWRQEKKNNKRQKKTKTNKKRDPLDPPYSKEEIDYHILYIYIYLSFLREAPTTAIFWQD